MGGTVISPILRDGDAVQHCGVEGRQIARARRGMVEEDPVGTAPGKGGRTNGGGHGLRDAVGRGFLKRPRAGHGNIKPRVTNPRR